MALESDPAYIEAKAKAAAKVKEEAEEKEKKEKKSAEEWQKINEILEDSKEDLNSSI